MNKVCSRCKEEKDIELFGIDNSRKDGRSYFCTNCWNIKCRKNVRKFQKKRVAQNKNWRTTESGKLSLQKSRKINRLKRKNHNPSYFVIEIARCRIRSVLKQKSVKKTSLTYQYIGCDANTLREWIESQFQDGMTWENRGGKDGWHIDHKVPCDYFDFNDFEQQKICFNYRNLQPLWGKDNLKKHTTLPHDYLVIIKNIKSCLL